MARDSQAEAKQSARPAGDRPILDRVEKTCCVVGAGPAGAILSILLARQGIAVTLLEGHGDFDRDFRGDTLHPAILEVLDEIGLADKLLALAHTKISTINAPALGGSAPVADLGRLKTRFPYIALMPQSRFLEFVTAEAARYPSFRLVMAASVQELIEEGGVIRGVRYRGRDGWHELRADLVVGADGRFSTIRRLARLPPAIKTSPPMDILWFRLPRLPGDPPGLVANFGMGRPLILLDRGEQWQVGYIIPKGTYQRIHAEGLARLRESVAGSGSMLAGRVGALQDWKQVSLLSVESDRLPRWSRPGLLLIGDAAHVMSPVGGNGINYAVQDAVAAANLLAEPLRARTLTARDLEAVQRRRERATRLTQAIVSQLQKLVLGRLLKTSRPAKVPGIVRLVLRLPLLSDPILRWLAYGLLPEHVRETRRAER